MKILLYFTVQDHSSLRELVFEFALKPRKIAIVGLTDFSLTQDSLEDERTRRDQ